MRERREVIDRREWWADFCFNLPFQILFYTAGFALFVLALAVIKICFIVLIKW